MLMSAQISMFIFTVALVAHKFVQLLATRSFHVHRLFTITGGVFDQGCPSYKAMTARCTMRWRTMICRSITLFFRLGNGCNATCRSTLGNLVVQVGICRLKIWSFGYRGAQISWAPQLDDNGPSTRKHIVRQEDAHAEIACGVQRLHWFRIMDVQIAGVATESWGCGT